MARLPGRSVVVEQLRSMLEVWQDLDASAVGGTATHRPEPKPPAVYAVSVIDHEQLAVADPLGVGRLMDEIAWRLDRLVRSGDVLGFVEPDTFLLATPLMAPSTAGALMDRIRGAVAMPVDLGGEPVSLTVAIGLAFAFDGVSPDSMITAAERDKHRVIER